MMKDVDEATARPVPAGTHAKPEHQFRLVDEDRGIERTINHSDSEYRDRYINRNIAKVTSDPDGKTFQHHTMIIHYNDGRLLELPLDSVPVRRSFHEGSDSGDPHTWLGMRLVRVRPYSRPVDHYARRHGTIFPVDTDGNMVLNDSSTPDLVDFRTTLEFNIHQRQQRLELAELINVFSGLLSMHAGVLHFGMSVTTERGFSVRPKMRTRGPKPPGAGEPPDANFRVSKQYKRVSVEAMRAWEKAGGHTLQRHNWHLTRSKLLERVIGEKILSVPPAQPGDRPTDFSVWQGEKKGAASKWADQATMHRAIGDVIHRNIDAIRNTTAGGRQWELKRYPVGYTTGSGWVKTAQEPGGNRGVFWDENLKGLTIIIRPRVGHIPTSTDPEAWYVHTSYPDRAAQ